MKKISIITSLVAIAVTLSSCNDFLNDNRYPLDKQTNNPQYWSNPSNVQKQVDNLYTNFIGNASGSSTSGLFYFQTLNDDQGSGVGGKFTDWAFTTVPSQSTVYTAPYEVIRQCNIIIEMVPQGTLVQAQKDKYVGIAKMIRAMKYYQLVRAYGDVPYISNSDDLEQVYGARTDRDLVMDYVYQDLKDAAAGIGKGANKKVFSSDMAYAMMSDICLYEGAYCKYRTKAENYKDPDNARAEKYFAYAAEAAKAIIDNPEYQLNPSYIGNYNSVDLASNKEMIFYKDYKDGVITHALIQYLCQTTPIAGINKDAFDAYLFKDGKPLALTSENKSDAGYIKKGVVSGDGTIGDMVYIGELLSVRDKRLSETIDSVVCYTGKDDNNMTWARGGAGLMTSSTGYTIRKYDNIDIPLNYRNQNNYTNAPVFWLAVVYLNYAEARAELNQLTDDDMNLTINKLYKRAELPEQTVASLSNMNDPANTSGISSLLWEIRRCRRCELIMDNEYRYWDLQRWHWLDRLDTRKNPNITLGANLGDVEGAPEASSMSGKYIKATPNVERVFSAREYLYPIPSGQISLNEDNLKQQPNWE